MPEPVLVDTDILVDVARGIRATTDFLTSRAASCEFGVSSITEMELIAGCRNKAELAQLQKFLSDYPRVRITPEIADQATEFMRQFSLSHGLLIPDALIAATAKITGRSLLTRNRKHFEPIPGVAIYTFP